MEVSSTELLLGRQPTHRAADPTQRRPRYLWSSSSRRLFQAFTMTSQFASTGCPALSHPPPPTARQYMTCTSSHDSHAPLLRPVSSCPRGHIPTMSTIRAYLLPGVLAPSPPSLVDSRPHYGFFAGCDRTPVPKRTFFETSLVTSQHRRRGALGKLLFRYQQLRRQHGSSSIGTSSPQRAL